MKQTFGMKILTIGFGCIVIIQGWQFFSFPVEAFIMKGMTDSPLAATLIVIGMITIGIAVGSEEKDD